MRFLLPLLLLSATCLLPPALGDETWAYVPASAQARKLGSLVVPGALSEEVIRYVGPKSLASAHPGTPAPVLAIDLPVVAASDEGRSSARVSGVAEAPGNVLWPDASGRITLDRPSRGEAPKGAAIANPWELRVRPPRAENETALACGAVIIAGEGGAVAIVNGRIVKRGDMIGKFPVVRIVPGGVVLTWGGSGFIVPRGRTTVVATVDD